MTRPRVRLLGLFIVVLVVLVAACGGSASTPGPTDGPPRTGAALRQALVEAFGPLWYCDPDFHPIQRAEEIDSARERWAEVQADAEAFAVITTGLGIPPDGPFTDEGMLAVYRAWKVLHAIALEPAGDAGFRFDHLAQPPDGGAEGQRITGTISRSGAIAIEQRAPAGEPICPICLSLGTPIDTLSGPVAVDDLRIGDAVWTLDAAGRRIAGTVLATGSTPAPVNHEVARLQLADGRQVTASPGHELADGRRLGDLRPGDVVGGSVVRSAALEDYAAAETFDIVVSGPTGIYLSDGIALASTLD